MRPADHGEGPAADGLDTTPARAGWQAVSRRVIPIANQRDLPVSPPAATDAAFDACSSAESFALMVLGDSMRPEFDDGDIVIIEPEGLATDGVFVLARWREDWMLRQLVRHDGGWALRTLNDDSSVDPIPDLTPVRGVVIQKSRPGRRRATRRYVA